MDEIGGVERLLAESAGVVAGDDRIWNGGNSRRIEVAVEVKLIAIVVEGLRLIGSSNSLLIERPGAVVDWADGLLVDFYDGRVLGGDAAVTPAVQAQASINRSVSQRD